MCNLKNYHDPGLEIHETVFILACASSTAGLVVIGISARDLAGFYSHAKNPITRLVFSPACEKHPADLLAGSAGGEMS